MNLIKFSNGKWGIRKGWIFHQYLWFPLCGGVPLWSRKKTKHFIQQCMTDEQTARSSLIALEKITDEVIE